MNASRAAVQQAIYGFRVSQLIFVAAKLRIADHLAAGPRTVRQLAEATATHEDALYRVLRTLAGLGIFAEEDGRVFRLTPAAEHLRSDARGSLRVAAEVVGQDWMWRAWGGLMHSVTTGETAFDHVYGESTWSWFATHPVDAQLFDLHMEGITSADTRAILAAFDFAPFPTIVDIAGGQGALLVAILRQHAHLRGVLFNLARVIDSARDRIAPELASRIDLVPGDFFEAVPRGGDLYILKNILHDWDDNRTRDVLTSCQRAMRPETKMLIIEQLICGPNQPCPGKMSDIQMLVRAGGRNRTEEEYRTLLAPCGFEVERAISTDAGPDILVAVRR
jgi:hypothetical protein